MIYLSFTSEVLRLGYQFEETYPSLFAEITKQLKVSFLDRRVLAQLMKDFSKGKSCMSYTVSAIYSVNL